MTAVEVTSLVREGKEPNRRWGTIQRAAGTPGQPVQRIQTRQLLLSGTETSRVRRSPKCSPQHRRAADGHRRFRNKPFIQWAYPAQPENHFNFQTANAPPAGCLETFGARLSLFPSPRERGWSAGRRQGGSPPSDNRLTRPAGQTLRSTKRIHGDIPLPGIAAFGMHAASDVGRSASRRFIQPPI